MANRIFLQIDTDIERSSVDKKIYYKTTPRRNYRVTSKYILSDNFKGIHVDVNRKRWDDYLNLKNYKCSEIFNYSLISALN